MAAVAALVVLVGYGAGIVSWAGASPWVYAVVCVLLGGVGVSAAKPR